MLKISFKNVGQGDSIIIEWEENNDSQIAIIDCNIYNKKNPVLDYLIEKRYAKIKYLILSHPHYDHYSGMSELINYCVDENINIEYFLHTSQQVPDFLQMAASSAIAEKSLQQLFLDVRNFRVRLNMKVALISSDFPSSTIPLGKCSLTILSPSLTEFDNYIKKISVLMNEEDGINNPNANWLSTVLRINLEEGYVLLTSDAEKQSLIRIDKRNGQSLSDKLVLAQSPHHGAMGNHNNAFWKKRNRETLSKIVFSVGDNRYKHPSKEAVNSFTKNNYELYSTNKVGALLGVDNYNELSVVITSLDMFSAIERVNSDKLNGDKVFTFNI
jgi:competence protein ComEC